MRAKYWNPGGRRRDPEEISDLIGGVLEQGAHPPRGGLALCGGGAVDLGDQRCEHRRAGRHLDDLHVGAVARADHL